MPKRGKGNWRVGTSGLVLPVPNKQYFPEEFRSGSRLTYYASLFNSIEINSSFYKIPMPATFEKWAAMVPEDFRFTVKLWRGITHTRGLAFVSGDLDDFMEAVNWAGPKKGCILVQLPPSVTDHYSGQLEKLLDRIWKLNPGNSWKLAVEFRHPSWYSGEGYRLLERHHASVVLHDMPHSGTMDPGKKPSFIYMRFHGLAGDYKGSYPDDLLRSYAGKIRDWRSGGLDVYAYFNNTLGEAILNLRSLAGWVGI